ncbi:MAG: thioredoxin family protein [Mycetocola sp.]
MKVELLHIDECPNWEAAAARLGEALNATGHSDANIVLRLLHTSEEAAEVPFAGSPTLTLDDEDLVPSEGRTTDLACRVYLTPNGLAGSPTTAQLVKAIQARGY